MANLLVTFPNIVKNEKRLKPTLEHLNNNLEDYDFFVFKIGKGQRRRAEK